MHPMYGVVLASCSYDKKVILWKENERGEWNKLFTHEKHAGSVNSIQVIIRKLPDLVNNQSELVI